MRHSGGCHCGNIKVGLDLSRAPDQMPLRSCSCSFCRAHGWDDDLSANNAICLIRLALSEQ